MHATEWERERELWDNWDDGKLCNECAEWWMLNIMLNIVWCHNMSSNDSLDVLASCTIKTSAPTSSMNAAKWITIMTSHRATNRQRRAAHSSGILTSEHTKSLASILSFRAPFCCLYYDSLCMKFSFWSFMEVFVLLASNSCVLSMKCLTVASRWAARKIRKKDRDKK